MKLLDSLLHRDSDPEPAVPSGAAAPSTGEGEVPIAGYDRLKANQVSEQLRRLSQSDLASVEAYERSHQERPEVLDKLRYLRGSEPIPDYDSLDAEEIATALHGADLETITMAREYEMKFHRREDVLTYLATIRRQRKSAARA